MKQRFRIIFSVFVLFAFASSPLAAAEGFADVRPGAWYEFYVYDLVDEGIINGVTETSFVPDGSVTRAQFAKILAAASGEDLTAFQNRSDFKDVPASAWYAPYVGWAKERGVVNGVGNGNFAPGAEISRQDMAVMIKRYSDAMNLFLPEKAAVTDFKDRAAIAGYAADAVTLMQTAGIISGFPDGTFRPKNSATRAEAAKMISVFLDRAMNPGAVDLETFREFMEKDVTDFEGDVILNFDEDPEDNFAVVREDVTVVESDGSAERLLAKDEAKGIYRFPAASSVSSLKKGDKLLISGDDYDDCAAVVVESVTVRGGEAVVVSSGGEVSDFFQYIQADMEIPVSEDMIEISDLPEGVAYAGTASAAPSSAAVPSSIDLSGNKKFSSKFNIGAQLGAFKVTGTTEMSLTVDVSVNYDFRLFGDDYVQCDLKLTTKDIEKLTVRLTTKTPESFKWEHSFFTIRVPLGETGAFIKGDIKLVIQPEGSLKSEVRTTKTKKTGFEYNSESGLKTIDQKSSKNEYIYEAEGKISVGVKAKLSLNFIEILDAGVSGEFGLEAKAVSDVLGGNDPNHNCYNCFDGDINQYRSFSFAITIGAGPLEIKPVDVEIARAESKIGDFYCSQRVRGGETVFGWGECPNIDKSVYWKAAYKAFTAQVHHSDDWTYDIKRFALCDINGDGVSELITVGGGTMDNMKIFTYRGGKVERIAVNTRFVFYNNGYVCVMNHPGNQSTEVYYCKVGNDLVIDIGKSAFGYVDWYVKEEYAIGGKTVSKAEVDRRISALVGTAAEVTPVYYENTAENRAAVFDGAPPAEG